MPTNLIDKIWAYLSKPFSSLDEFIAAISGGVNAILAVDSKTGWLFLLSGLCAAWLVYRASRKRGDVEAQGSFREFLLPRSIYLHRSAIADYKYVVFDVTIKGVVYVPLVAGTSQAVYNLLRPLSLDILPVGITLVDPYIRIALLTVLTVVFADFSFFFAHYLMHRIPFLWPFHEVHHSAEVLTPVTVYRIHPVEDLVTAILGGVVSALSAKTLAVVSGADVSEATLFRLNVFNFFFFAFAFQLRHSHVWLSYGPIISRILISPAQHHIHHSVNPRHWNKNFGFMFAFWDQLSRTLYVPRERERIEFGVPGIAPEDFTSVTKIYLLPFVKSWRLVRRSLRLKRGAVTGEAAARMGD